jgi:hypothetical protein
MYYLLILNGKTRDYLPPYNIVEEIDNKFSCTKTKNGRNIRWFSTLDDIPKPNSDLSSDFTGYVNRCNLIALPFDSFEDAKNADQTHPEYFI